jgi:hypothetical protein
MGLTCIVLALFFGCGGEKGSTSPRKTSKSFIKFENRFFYGNMTLRITINACHQEFDLKPGEDKIVECVPEDGSTSFEVVIAAPQSYVTGQEPPRWTATVSGGQTVTITGTGTNERPYIEVHD